jgi:hypothetical protein
MFKQAALQAQLSQQLNLALEQRLNGKISFNSGKV